MSNVCPISFKQINEKAARINGALTVTTLAVYAATQSIYVIAFLAVDFLIRGFLSPKFSPLAIISKTILKTLKAKPKMTNAGPKLFAAKLGFIFSILILALSFLKLDMVNMAVISIFMFFAFLEAAFGFCLACKVYPLLLKFKKS